MIIIGTKCATMPDAVYKEPYIPESLGSIYREIANEYGRENLYKPKPRDEYRKMYNPLSDIDRPSFRRLPEEIVITQPARLFRSTAWSYQGRFYTDCELFWEFEYKYKYSEKWVFDWMPVRLLSYCYISQNLEFIIPQKRKNLNQQLTLF